MLDCPGEPSAITSVLKSRRERQNSGVRGICDYGGKIGNAVLLALKLEKGDPEPRNVGSFYKPKKSRKQILH